MEINQVKISRILNPTSIDLGEYVINPFMGCEFACLFCYVRSNRVVARKNKPWGEYLDVRANAPELLEKELVNKKPKTVLLGSTTECFQPQEGKFKISRRILEILNRHKTNYVILTRSPAILDCLDLLKEGFCRQIYFSVNDYPREFKERIEPKSPGFILRDQAVNKLLEEDVPVIPYFSPVLPWISELSGVFAKFPRAKGVEFECLNFRLANIGQIIEIIALVEPALKVKYTKMLVDEKFYHQVWSEFKKYIANQAKSAGKEHNIYVHGWGDYFKNTYR